jgi:hypothetical protein
MVKNGQKWSKIAATVKSVWPFYFGKKRHTQEGSMEGVRLEEHASD